VIFLLLSVIAYLAGSIPFGLVLCALFRDRDPREEGSGNTGMSNVWRLYGVGLGLATLAGDMGKGAACILAAEAAGLDLQTCGAIGAIATLGHCYSAFTDFRGGKGVATAGGVLLAFSPLLFLCLLGIWAALRTVTGKASPGALAAVAVLVPLVNWLLPGLEWMGVAMALLIALRHRENIARLWKGHELPARDYQMDSSINKRSPS
jgi:acyl phosphate:glycerol-3-phosphate acyltransferase